MFHIDPETRPANRTTVMVLLVLLLIVLLVSVSVSVSVPNIFHVGRYPVPPKEPTPSDSPRRRLPVTPEHRPISTTLHSSRRR